MTRRNLNVFAKCLMIFSVLMLFVVSVWVVFFSSRRRHTRLQGDWSSDVCSSDLRPLTRFIAEPDRHAYLEALTAIGLSESGSALGRTIEIVGAQKDGTRFPIELSLSDRKSVV